MSFGVLDVVVAYLRVFDFAFGLLFCVGLHNAGFCAFRGLE